jgi:hypothetical protein
LLLRVILVRNLKKFTKKAICIMLVAVSLFSTAVFADAKILGDIDNDGNITVSDARLALRAAVKLEELEDEKQTLADMDSNGKITVEDARSILRIAVDLDESFASILREQSAKQNRRAFEDIEEFNISYANLIYKNADKWCCYYSINAVLRPALKAAGYSQTVIDRVAPVYYDADRVHKLAENYEATDTNSRTIKNMLEKYGKKIGLIDRTWSLFVPSLLMDYYNRTPDVCEVYTLHEYYDDVIDDVLIERSENADEYVPMVGDMIFMTNKTATYHDGIPTIDHTAQIIEVYSDGSFLCTEGCIKDSADDAGDFNNTVMRVRERRYIYNETTGTYTYYDKYQPDWNLHIYVLTAVHLDLSSKY